MRMPEGTTIESLGVEPGHVVPVGEPLQAIYPLKAQGERLVAFLILTAADRAELREDGMVLKSLLEFGGHLRRLPAVHPTPNYVVWPDEMTAHYHHGVRCPYLLVLIPGGPVPEVDLLLSGWQN